VDSTGASTSLYNYCDRAVLILSTQDRSPFLADNIEKVNTLRREYDERILAIVVMVSAADAEAVATIASENNAQVDVWYDAGYTWGAKYDDNRGYPSYHLVSSGMELAVKDSNDVPSTRQIQDAIR